MHKKISYYVHVAGVKMSSSLSDVDEPHASGSHSEGDSEGIMSVNTGTLGG